MEPGDFLVFIPFARKGNQQAHRSIQSEELPDQRLAPNFADTAWSDMMQDLSSLGDVLNHNNTHNVEVDAPNVNNPMPESPVRPPSLRLKRKWPFDGSSPEKQPDETIMSILQSTEDNNFDGQYFQRFIQVLESTDCLSDPLSGNCLLREYILRDSEVLWPGDCSNSCMCASWLKTILKAFAFLNIFSACSQMQGVGITWDSLNEALSQLERCGLEVLSTDIRNLSVLCPKMVLFVDNEVEATKVSNLIHIIEQKDEVINKSVTGRRQASALKLISAMKKRESSFKSNLWRIVKLLLHGNGNNMAKSFTLEGLLIHVKGGFAASGKEGKQEKRSSSEASNSSIKKRCHETNPLDPIEMVQHLRNGIGCEGQIVHIEEIGAKTAIYTEIPNELSEDTKSVLKRIGISRLYSHQAESIRASLAGKNVAVATMTSSGKSLCYNLPVLEILSQQLLSCAIYLFPTKALAQDQLKALLTMTEGFCASLNIGIYDGDTSAEDRMWLRDNARLVFY